MIRADRAAPGEVGALDFDPICDCQDPDGLTLVSVVLERPGAASVHAISTFRVGTEQRVVDLRLVWTAAGWRVDDFRTAQMPSLRKLLGGKRSPYAAQ